MSLHSQKGRLPTARTIALLLALVGLVGAILWSSGYLPIRLRRDGIYGGCAPANSQQPIDTTIERPKLYLPSLSKRRAGYVAVVRVIDGDTLEIQRETGREKVRLIGIDTDEIGNDRVDPAGAGWQATMFVFNLLEPDPQVRLEYDTERKDKYERTLAYAHLPDGRMLNEVILKSGWAKVMRIPPNTKHADEFKALEVKARSAGLGRWKQ